MVLRSGWRTTKHCLGILKLARLVQAGGDLCVLRRAGPGNHHRHYFAKVWMRRARKALSATPGVSLM
jgi:hypothetical protein